MSNIPPDDIPTRRPAQTTSTWSDGRHISAMRSLVLMGIGALIGLIIAGYALFTAKGTSTLSVPPEDVALVNQQPISRSDYLIQLQSLYGIDQAHATAEQRGKVLDDMIREELFVQRGKELDVASTDADVRSAMVNAVEQIVAADAITALPSEAKLRAYFDAHRERYASEGSMTVEDIVFSNPADAGQARQALIGNATAWSTVAERFHGKSSGKLRGEEFYFAAKVHLGDALFDIARGLPDGEVSAPIPTADGTHVLAMMANKKPVEFDFAAARNQLLVDYRTEATKRLQIEDGTFFRKRANVLIAPDMR